MSITGEYMAYKPTSEIYALRSQSVFAVNNSSTSASAGTEIETNLDTLNREVLLIWEIDINPPTLGTQVGDCVAGGVAIESFTYHCAITKEDEPLQLDDAGYIGGYRANIINQGPAGCIFNSDWNPDTRAFVSNSGKNSPLAIVTGGNLYLRQGYDRDTTQKTADSLTSNVRMMVQRAKADADTYAALLTGASL